MLEASIFDISTSNLLLFLLSCASAAQDPFRLSMDVRLVLDGHAAEMAQDVLHGGVGVAAGVSAQVVDPLDAGKEEVDDSDNDCNTDRVAPDDDDCDNGGPGRVVVPGEGILGNGEEFMLSAGEPSENTEQGRNNIHEEDSADQLPGWPGLSATGNEDEPVLNQ